MHPSVQFILLQMDKIVLLLYSVKMRGTHKKVLSYISKNILDYLLAKGITVTVEYLPGALNRKPISSREQWETQANGNWISKCFKQYAGFGSFQTSIFLLSELFIQSVFSPNSGNYGPENLRIRTLFTQWSCHGSWTHSAREGKLFK